jgi:uncharacterized RDD family membrane protein YckC
VSTRKRLLRYPQLLKDALISGRTKSNPENRAWAKAIDAALIQACVWTLGFLFPGYVWLPSIVLWSCIDAFGRGQSPGKWLLGLHVIDIQKSSPPRVLSGFLRNFAFIVLSANLGREGLVPTVFLGLSLTAITAEAYFAFTLRTGIRVGDVLGYTRVFDYKDEHTKFIEQFLKKEEVS